MSSASGCPVAAMDHDIWRDMHATQESRSQPHDTTVVGTMRSVIARVGGPAGFLPVDAQAGDAVWFAARGRGPSRRRS